MVSQLLKMSFGMFLVYSFYLDYTILLKKYLSLNVLNDSLFSNSNLMFCYYSRELGQLSNKTGACNCMVLGALPDQESKYKLKSEIKQFEQSSDVDKKSNFNTTKTDMNEEEKAPFLKSVQRDLCSIEDLAKTIDLKSAQKFVDVVDRCTGNILVTGIGKVFKMITTLTD